MYQDAKRLKKKPFLHTVTLSLKNIKKEKLHIDQKYLKEPFEIFFTNKCTHLLKTSNLWPKGVQIAAWEQCYSPCWSQNPNLRGVIENYFHKKTNLVIKPLNLFVFGSLAWQISSKWSFQRNVGLDLERAQTSEHCYTWSGTWSVKEPELSQNI